MPKSCLLGLPPFLTQASKQAFPNRNHSLRFFSSPLKFKASPLPTFFAKQVYYGLPVWGSYSIERVAFLEPHDFVLEVCMEYPQYTYYIIYIYTVYRHLHIHIHSNTYIYIILYSYINWLWTYLKPSRLKWTSETLAKPQRQQWIDVLFVWPIISRWPITEYLVAHPT